MHFIVIVGSNPLFEGFKLTKSMFRRSSHSWAEGEGMVRALYFRLHLVRCKSNSECKMNAEENEFS